MQELNPSDVELLKEKIESLFGNPIKYPKDCYALSVAIDNKIGRQVSETTLKRIWNLVKSPFNPSKYTLDSLSLYLGYRNWEDFVCRVTDSQKEKENRSMWFELREKAMVTSRASFKNIRNRMGIPYENSVVRQFAHEHTKAFLESDKSATAFIAPGGYGKSTIISHIAEDFFLSDNCLYPNDIVWFIDCGVLDALITKDFDIESFLLQLLGYNTEISFHDLFTKFPEYVHGRVVIIIDGLNEITSKVEKIHILIDNILKIIALNSEVSWFKIVVTLRTDLWNYLSKSIQDFEMLKKLWYNVEFSVDSSNISNIPSLKFEEVEAILEKNNVKNYLLMDNIIQNEVYSIVRIPYFLHLYIALVRDSHYMVNDIDLLKEFVSRKIINTKSGGSKLQLIDYLLFSTNYGVDTDIIVKKQVAHLLEDKLDEFTELVSFGILYEYRVESKFLEYTSYVKFSHQILFEFLLANFWLREFGFSNELFEGVSDFYKHNIDLKYNISSWLIKYAFKENKTEVIKNLFQIIDDVYVKRDNDPEEFVTRLVTCVGVELRRYEEIRSVVLPYYATSIARKYYYEKFLDFDMVSKYFAISVTDYLANSSSTTDLFYGNYILFLNSYLSNNTNALSHSFEKILQIDLSELPNNYYMLYLSTQIVYYYTTEQKIPNSLMTFITERALLNFESIKQNNLNLTYFDIAIIDAFAHCGLWNTIVTLIERFILTANYTGNPVMYRFLLIFYASALFRQGNINKSREILESFNIDNDENYPANGKFYWHIRMMLIYAEFLVKIEEVAVAKEYLKKVLEYARHFGFERFVFNANKILEPIKD